MGARGVKGLTQHIFGLIAMLIQYFLHTNPESVIASKVSGSCIEGESGRQCLDTR